MNFSDLSPALLDKLNNLEPHLRDIIRGQDHVIPRVCSVLQRSELGFTKPNRTKGSFLFLGPTGVGKTELTLAFTRYLFSGGKLLRFDMSEFQTQESLGVLLGRNLGEVGTLGLAVKRAGSGTLLFDESEKAHPRVLDILLQILDAARITLASGKTLDLSGFYVVLTSNLGAADVMQLQHAPLATMERHVLTRAQRSFRPELFARITEKLVFGRLSYDVQLEIARQILAGELEFLAVKGIELSCSAAVLPFLVQRGFHPRPRCAANVRCSGETRLRCSKQRSFEQAYQRRGRACRPPRRALPPRKIFSITNLGTRSRLPTQHAWRV